MGKKGGVDNSGYHRNSSGDCTGRRTYRDGQIGECDHPSHHSSGGCFPRDTRVLTPNGMVWIDSLKHGSQIFTLDTKTNRLVVGRVKKLLHRGYKYVFTVSLKFSEETKKTLCTKFEWLPQDLRVTADHSLRLANGEWIEASQLKVGDQLQDMTGSMLEVTAVQSQEHAALVPVYNVIPYGADKTFVVEGVVAHSFTHFRMTRTLLHLLSEKLGSLVIRKTRMATA